MAIPDTSHWALGYDDPRSCTRFLFSIPPPMLRDLRMLAKSRDVTVSELLRQMITREVADFLEQRPDLQPSFKGQLLFPSAASDGKDSWQAGDCP